MKSMALAICVSLSMVLAASNPAAAQESIERPYRPPRDNGPYGSGMGDTRPRAPKIEKEEPTNTAFDEQWKWLLAAAVMGLIGYTVWRFVKETNRVTHRKRQPWEIE